jgi:peptidoglycan/LPS O-acetylase OafA/YrhL
MEIASQPTAARSAPSHHGSFRPDIEGLRGIAILMVVLYHIGLPGVGGGFSGVDVFFVLSGYLITDLLVKEAERTGKISLVQFYARRARRLLPAAILVLVVTFLAGAVVYSPLEQEFYAKSGLATAAYLSNVHFMREATDYFATEISHDPFLHTWSLAVEEQFYLVWPLLVAWGLTRGGSRRRLVTLITMVSAIALVGCVLLTMRYKPWAFFGSPARAWEFGLGGLATLLPVTLLRSRPALCRAMGWAGLIGIAISAVALTGDMPFPGPAAMLPVLATAAVLIGGAGAPGEGVSVVLSTAPVQHVGRLSYSWYLWHWPVLALAAVAFPTISLPGRMVAALAALGAAAASFAVMERRIRFHPVLVSRPVLSLGLAAGLSAVGLAAALGAQGFADHVSSGRRQQLYAAAVNDAAALSRRCVLGFTSPGLRQCVFGDSLSLTTVVLFGDSHASQWFPAVQEIAKEQGWRVVTLVKASCAFAMVPVYNPALGYQDDACAEWRQLALKRILELKPRLVVAANSIGYVQREGRSDGLSQVSPTAWRNGIRQTLGILDSAGVPAVFLRDTPRPKANIPLCLSRAAYRGRPESVCSEPRYLAVDDDLFEIERSATTHLRSVETLDMSDAICGPDICQEVQSDMVVHRDRSHLTATFVTSLAPELAQRLVPLVEGTEARQ